MSNATTEKQAPNGGDEFAVITDPIQTETEVASLQAQVEAVRATIMTAIEAYNSAESGNFERPTLVGSEVSIFRFHAEKEILVSICHDQLDSLSRALKLESFKKRVGRMDEARILRENVEKYLGLLSVIEEILQTVGKTDAGLALIQSVVSKQGFSLDISDGIQTVLHALIEGVRNTSQGSVDVDLKNADEIELSALVALDVLNIFEPYRDIVISILNSSIDEKEKKRLLFRLVSLEEQHWPDSFSAYLEANPWLKE